MTEGQRKGVCLHDSDPGPHLSSSPNVILRDLSLLIVNEPLDELAASGTGGGLIPIAHVRVTGLPGYSAAHQLVRVGFMPVDGGPVQGLFC